MQAFVPKSRRPKFDLGLRIVDLNNVPLVSGTSYIKWHLPSSSAAEHRGRTAKAIIKDHKVTWDYEKTISVRLTIDRIGNLQESEIHFEVLQEYSSGSRSERIALGNVRLNLAEYVEGSDDTDDGITRRYLMQESKINSTLKISISMKQIDGDRNFVAPPLKTARVFGGIAGIMHTAEQGEADDLGHMSSMTSKTREIGELQDMYRRTLAASWAAQVGELPADECIENIFAGGDGWGKDGNSNHLQIPGLKKSEDSTGDAGSEGEIKAAHKHRRNSSSFEKFSKPRQRGHARTNSKGNYSHATISDIGSRASIEQHVQSQSSSAEENRKSYRRAPEIDEIDAREDLRSWETSASS